MTVVASGTTTPTTIGAEEVLATVTTAGYFHAAVDVSNLAPGEEVTITIRKKVLLTDTIVVGAVSGGLYSITVGYDRAQTLPVVELPPIKSEHEYMLSINQVAGTPRAFKWSVDSP